MKREVAGWCLLVCGWSSFLFALGCPALVVNKTVLDYGGGSESMIGLACLCNTFIPLNWLFAPSLFFYMVSNLLMFASPVIVVARGPIRKSLGCVLLLCFPVTLSAPWCASEVTAVLAGCFLWMSSFLTVGLGLVLVSGSFPVFQVVDS